jgi:hypothetical protein
MARCEWVRSTLLTLAACLCCGPAVGQGLPSASWQGDLGQLGPWPVWPLSGSPGRLAADGLLGGWAQAPQFFRMPGSFSLASASIGLAGGGERGNPLPRAFRQTEGRLRVAGGVDTGCSDFRLPGDPGGPGFYRLESQVRLFDWGPSSLALGLKAATPIWQVLGGRMAVPSVVSPSLAWFQEAGDRLAVQVFIATNIAPESPALPFNAGLQYGLGVATPLLGSPGAGRTCYVFVEALGGRQNSLDAGGPASLSWQVVPGIHWRGGKDWWLSGGLLLPLDPTDLNAPLWQITCSRHF